eukprot:1155396-Pelagomonas_calceolata.AAC.1
MVNSNGPGVKFFNSKAIRRIQMADSWPKFFSTNTQFEFMLKGAVAAAAAAAAAQGQEAAAAQG